MAIIQCRNCGRQISDKAAVCPGCGAGQVEEQFQSPATRTCEECGEQVPEASRECPNCGCPISVKPVLNIRFSRKKSIILSIIVSVVIIAGVGIAVYDSEPVQSYIAEAERNRAAIEASKLAYKEAAEAEKKHDYELAIRKYKAVIKEDGSYEKARERIAELKEIYKEELLTEAASYAKSKKYNEAIQNVNRAIAALGSSDELKALKQEYIALKAEQFVKVIVTDKSVTPKNISKWIFSNYVNFTFDITNNSDKPIKGVEGVLTVKDLFGKEIIQAGCDFTGHIIDVGSTVTIDELSFECNEFMDEHMELYNTDFSDLQFSYEVSSIIYTDGSTVVPE